MSEDFECDFSEGSLNERKTAIKKKQETKDRSLINKSKNESLSNNPKSKEDSVSFKPSKLSKKNLKYFLIYFDGSQSSALIRNYFAERRIEITSDRDLDFSRNVYFMLIDHRRTVIKGIFKKDYVKESSTEDLSKKIYKIKIEIKSRQEISHMELVEDYSYPKESLKAFFRFSQNLNVPSDSIDIGRGLSMVEISDDASVDTFESIRNSMIKKEEAERKKSRNKRDDSYRKRSRSLSSSSEDSQTRKSIKKEIQNETSTNLDMNYYKLQYENYLKNAASFLSSQSIGNANNPASMTSKSANPSNGMNPLINHIYSNQFANFYPQNQPQYKPELNQFQNNFPNMNMMPNMFPMLNPYMHMVPFNPNFSQSFLPVAMDMSEDQKKHIERININNYNFIKNTNTETKKKKTAKSRSSSSSSSLNSVKSSKRGKYFDLKHLNEYKELELKMKKKDPEMNMNDMCLMDNDFNKKKEEKKQSRSSSSDNNKELYAHNSDPDKINKTVNAKLDSQKINASSSHSRQSKKSRSISSSSSYSREDANYSRKESKKQLFGNKRRRSDSRKDSRDNSYSDLSNDSKPRYYPKYNNDTRRPYYSNNNKPYIKYERQDTNKPNIKYERQDTNKPNIKYERQDTNKPNIKYERQDTYKPNSKYEPQDTNRFRKYNDYKINNSNDYNQNKKIRLNDNNFGYKNNSHFDRNFKHFDRDRDTRQQQDHSRNYINYKMPFNKEGDRYTRTESPPNNFKQKEIEGNLSNNYEEVNTNASQRMDEVKEISNSLSEPRDANYRRVSNFSNFPQDISHNKLDTGIAKDPKIINSKFTNNPYNNFIDNSEHSQKDEPNRPYNSNFKNRQFNSRYNYINGNKNKNKNFNLNYRYETINDFNKYKIPSENQDSFKDDKNLTHLSNDPITKVIQTNKLDNSTKDPNPEKHEFKPEKKSSERENTISESFTSSKIEKLTTSITNHKISINSQDVYIKDNEIKSNAKNKDDIMVTITEDINRKSFTANITENSIETTQCKNTQNISINNIAVNSIDLNSVKSNSVILDKNTISNIVNQSTQKGVPMNPNIKFSAPKIEEINKPSKSLTDLSAMLEKNNNFKIINVLGKKKIILNKDRKNPDIKLKNINS